GTKDARSTRRPLPLRVLCESFVSFVVILLFCWAHRAEADAGSQMAVRQLRRVADMRARRVDAQDRFGDRLKIGPEMHRRFEAEDRHLHRLDADMPEHFLVVRLDAL